MAAPPHLLVGHHYAVVEAFDDFDGVHHPVGEVMRLEERSYWPYDDGHVLTMSGPNGERWSVRLRDAPGGHDAFFRNTPRFLARACAWRRAPRRGRDRRSARLVRRPRRAPRGLLRGDAAARRRGAAPASRRHERGLRRDRRCPRAMMDR
ncbi:MAG: DUF3601 domain-containing protein [Myxococcales bacterium]|nr:DUF3601 domain-containing protein [Myxococcales bacterium]